MPIETAVVPPRSLRRFNIDWTDILFRIAVPVLAMLAALLVGAVLLLLLDVNPFVAYAALLEGAFGSVSSITQSLVKATPLLLVGLGICIAFRASVINIGGEGQIILGALMATWFSLQFRTWPGWLLLPATIIMSFMAGAAWGFIPGILKARLRVNEILSTIMMNFIALQLMNLLLRGPLMDPESVSAGTFLAKSERLPEQVWLARLVPQTLLHTGMIFAVVLAVVVYIFLWRTTIGYRIRAVGLNPHAARYAGIKVPFYQALSLTLAGGFAGLAGVSRSDRRTSPAAGRYHQWVRLFRHRGGAIRRPASAGDHSGLISVRQLAGWRRQDATRGASAVGIGRYDHGSGGIVRSRLCCAVAPVVRASSGGSSQRAGGQVMEEIFSTVVIVGILTSAIRLATPYLFASIGETFAQLSGVLNLGVDGIMLVGAFAAFFVVLNTGQSLVGCARRPHRWAVDGLAHVGNQCHAQSRTRHQRHRVIHVRVGPVVSVVQGHSWHRQDRRWFSTHQDPASGRYSHHRRNLFQPQRDGLHGLPARTGSLVGSGKDHLGAAESRPPGRIRRQQIRSVSTWIECVT